MPSAAIPRLQERVGQVESRSGRRKGESLANRSGMALHEGSGRLAQHWGKAECTASRLGMAEG